MATKRTTSTSQKASQSKPTVTPAKDVGGGTVKADFAPDQSPGLDRGEVQELIAHAVGDLRSELAGSS